MSREAYQTTCGVIQQAAEALYGLVSAELPPPSSDFARFEDHRVPMRDGARLATRVFLPTGAGPWPVLVVRNPYTPVDDDAFMQQAFLVFLRHGYAVVYQQVRGMYSSEGEWMPFENERRDSLDTLHWTAAQPFCNGNIGTYGGSYLGHVQWAVADIAPPQLKAMYISVFGGEPYRLYYENGLFRQGTWTLWATQMMDRGNRPDDGSRDMELFRKAADTRPPLRADEALYGRQCPWYRNWISSPSPAAPYWTQGFWGEFGAIAERARVPVTFQGGWFDIFLPAMTETFARLPAALREKSRMLVGPWHHGNTTGGDLAYPDEGRFGAFQMKDALSWFDHHLKGADYPHPKGGITAYGIGRGVWHHWPGGRIPAAGKTRLYLDTAPCPGLPGTGKAMALAAQPPGDAAPAEYTYDPVDPVPSLGGNLLTEYGGGDGQPQCSITQPPPGWRQDVLSFVSTPLPGGLDIAGAMRVRLRVASSAEDSAFTVRVMELDENGASHNIRDGACTLSFAAQQAGVPPCGPGQAAELDIHLADIVWHLAPGSRLRLDVSSSGWPAWHRHPNRAGGWATLADADIARQTVYASGESFVEIPRMREESV